MGCCHSYDYNLTKKQIYELKKCNYNDIQLFSFDNLNVWGKVVDVYDGDTYDVVFYRNKELIRVKIRGYGYNCAELKVSKEHENREKEIKDGKRGRNRLIQLVSNCNIDVNKEYTKEEIKKILIKNTKLIYIKFQKGMTYGRYVADVYETNKSKKSFGQILIEEKLAITNFGEKINKYSLTLKK